MRLLESLHDSPKQSTYDIVAFKLNTEFNAFTPDTRPASIILTHRTMPGDEVLAVPMVCSHMAVNTLIVPPLVPWGLCS